MQNTTFIRNFIKYPNIIGAVCPSSKYLAKKMICDIDFNKSMCIVEYGPGTGIFTEELIKNKKEDTVLLVLELNIDLYEALKNKYLNYNNVYIINDSAENIRFHLKKHNFNKADYIVSGLPFTAFPTQLSEKILNNTTDILNDNGKFITFQYTLLKKNFMKQFFNKIDLDYEFINLPPAFILKCSNLNCPNK